MVIRIRHTGIVVSDLKKSLHFYRDLLGLKIQREMDESGKLKLDEMLTHHFKLEDINSVFDLLENGEVGRVIIEF